MTADKAYDTAEIRKYNRETSYLGVVILAAIIRLQEVLG
jgi:hypothetical protein